ncbi:MAG: DUF192 domain-containing protein [Pseudomonadota bacterium]
MDGLYAMRVAAVFGVLVGAASASEETLPRLALTVDGTPIQAEVARTWNARHEGLAGRAALAEDAGMLFVFRRPGRPCFWMKDTLLPLSLAFINERGMIVQREELLPGDEQSICARQPVRFALEVARNGLPARQLQFGRRVVGLPQLPRVPADPSRFAEPD